MAKNKDKVKKDHLLVEYEMAQISAEHHDALVWQTISVVWGGSLILMGFVVSSLGNNSLRIPIIVVSILGIFLTFFTWYQAKLQNSVKRQKYERCKYLESILGFEQHSKLVYPGKNGFNLFTIMMGCFVIVWISIIIVSLL